MTRIRYYADAVDEDTHTRILQLLDEVPVEKEVHRVESIHEQVPNNHTRLDADTAYETDIRHNRLISRAMDVPPGDLMGHTPPTPALLNGRIAVCIPGYSDDYEVAYLSPMPARATGQLNSDNWDWPVNPVDMLCLIRDNRSEVINRLEAGLKTETREASIISDWFSDDRTPIDSGQWQEWVGPSRPQDHGLGLGGAIIDCLVEHENGDCTLIEVKPEWDAQSIKQAIGQSVVGRSLRQQFGADNVIDDSGTECIILVGESEFSPEMGWPGGSRAIVAAAQECGVKVWMRDCTQKFRLLNSYL